MAISRAAQLDERASKQASLLVGLVTVVLSGSFAGIFVGAFWRSAGLLIGPGYWGVYLGALLLGRRWLALGMIAALPIALPAFFGLAVLSSFPTTP